MRYAIVICLALLLGCNEDALPQAQYSDGSEWKPTMPLDPGRVAPENMDLRQWDRFVAQAGIQADSRIRTFEPTWAGFATPPTDSFNYMDFGAIVMVWNSGSTAVLGTSNSTLMTWAAGSLPTSIRPSDFRTVTSLVHSGFAGSAGVGTATISSAGGITFAVSDTVATSPEVVFNSSGFNNAAVSKGLPIGWILIYPK